MYAKDPALTYAEKGKVDQSLKADNELSLPLGDGERAGFPLSQDPGFYRHKRDITIIKN